MKHLAIFITAFWVAIIIQPACGEDGKEVFRKDFGNGIKMSAIETNGFPNLNDHTDWSHYRGPRGDWHLQSVKDYQIKLCLAEKNDGQMIWTNRNFIFENVAVLQSSTLFDATIIDGDINVCYQSYSWFCVDTISSHWTNSSPMQIGGLLLARVPFRYSDAITNAIFGITSNGVPTLVAHDNQYDENITAAWIYKDHHWTVDLANCKPSSITNELSKCEKDFWILRSGEWKRASETKIMRSP